MSLLPAGRQAAGAWCYCHVIAYKYGALLELNNPVMM